MANSSGRQDPNREHPEEDAIVTEAAAVPIWRGNEGSAAVSVSKHVYSRKAVLSAAYKLSDRCAVLVDSDDDRWVLYVFAGTADGEKPLVEALVKELADQALRDQLEEEFGGLRTLLVAQAFSEGNLLEPLRDDADDSTDPQGTRQRR